MLQTALEDAANDVMTCCERWGRTLWQMRRHVATSPMDVVPSDNVLQGPMDDAQSSMNHNAKIQRLSTRLRLFDRVLAKPIKLTWNQRTPILVPIQHVLPPLRLVISTPPPPPFPFHCHGSAWDECVWLGTLQLGHRNCTNGSELIRSHEAGLVELD